MRDAGDGAALLTNSSIFPPTGALVPLYSWVPADSEGLHRCCYVTAEVRAFLASPAALVRDWGSLPPRRQLMSKLDAFVEGDHWAVLAAADTPPAFRKLHPARPEGPNVWEMRTWDVRLFGWFPGPRNTFVGVWPALKKDLLRADGSGVEDPALYQAGIESVVQFRRKHGLDTYIWKGAQDDLPIHLKR